MARLLTGQGVRAERLVLDERSLDTAGNVAATIAQVRAKSHSVVVACSDSYHLPRIRLMLALEGVTKVRGFAPRGLGRAPLGHSMVMSLREILATPYHLVRRALRWETWRP